MKNYSLKWRLVLTIISAFVLVWTVAFAWLYFNIEKKMTETLDERLSASAHMVARLLAQIPPEQLAQTANPMVSELYQQNLLACEVSYFSSDIMLRQKIVARTRGAPTFLTHSLTGFSSWHEHGVAWRSFVLKQGDLRVVAAEKMQLRDSLLAEILKSILIPLILTLLLCIGLILWIVRSEFAPIEQISRTLAKQEQHPDQLNELLHLDMSGIPREIQPFVKNIVSLIQQLNISLQNEKDFSAYAAHELRSPLTAIKTNVQLSKMMAQTTTQNDLQILECLTDAELSIVRYQQLLEQLLLLSKSEYGAGHIIETIRLNEVMIEAIQQLKTRYPEIEKSLQIDVDSLQTVQFSFASAVIVIKNIIENSLKHAQTTQPIQVYMHNQILIIRDFGIGLNAQELDLATRRFWRKDSLQQGYGLGLALCQVLLQQYGYILSLTSEMQQGLRVEIDFSNAKISP